MRMSMGGSAICFESAMVHRWCAWERNAKQIGRPDAKCNEPQLSDILGGQVQLEQLLSCPGEAGDQGLDLVVCFQARIWRELAGLYHFCACELVVDQRRIFGQSVVTDVGIQVQDLFGIDKI